MSVLLTRQFTAFGVGVFVLREEPEADENLRAVEELAGEGEAGEKALVNQTYSQVGISNYLILFLRFSQPQSLRPNKQQTRVLPPKPKRWLQDSLHPFFSSNLHHPHRTLRIRSPLLS